MIAHEKDAVQNEFFYCSVCMDENVTRDPFFYLWKDKRWSIMRCRNCRHQFVYPFVTQLEQEEIYGDHYFSEEGDWVSGIWKLGYKDAEERLRKEAQLVLNMLPIRRGKLLEIGCAGGFFLDEARKSGFHVMGIEINRSMATHAEKQLGLTVIQGRIEDIEKDDFNNQFDVVVMMDILEHIPKPHSVIQRVNHWLTPHGFLLIRGPLVNNPIVTLKETLRRLTKIEKQLPGYPLDANMFNKKSLAHLVEQFDMKVCAWINETNSFANVLAQKSH